MKRHLLNFLLIIAVISLAPTPGYSRANPLHPPGQPTISWSQLTTFTGTTSIPVTISLHPDGSDFITNHPPDSYLANYSYTEVSWHRRELLDMMTAQIDIVLPVYFGRRRKLSYWSKTGLQNLVSATQTLIGEGRTPPKIGMFFDTNVFASSKTMTYRQT